MKLHKEGYKILLNEIIIFTLVNYITYWNLEIIFWYFTLPLAVFLFLMSVCFFRVPKRNFVRKQLIFFDYEPNLISLYEEPNKKNTWNVTLHTGTFKEDSLNKYDITHQIHYTNLDNFDYPCNEPYYECDEDKYLNLEKFKADVIKNKEFKYIKPEKIVYQNALYKWCY